MTEILGVSSCHHGSAAVVVDGDIVAAAQKERFTRIQHDHVFPMNAIAYCRLGPGDLDPVGSYDKPLVTVLIVLSGSAAAPFISTLF